MCATWAAMGGGGAAQFAGLLPVIALIRTSWSLDSQLYAGDEQLGPSPRALGARRAPPGRARPPGRGRGLHRGDAVAGDRQRCPGAHPACFERRCCATAAQLDLRPATSLLPAATDSMELPAPRVDANVHCACHGCRRCILRRRPLRRCTPGMRAAFLRPCWLWSGNKGCSSWSCPSHVDAG